MAPDTMSFSDIITLIFLNNRHLVLEEPIIVTDRKLGISKIGIETAFQTIMEIINIVILFNPMNLPAAFAAVFHYHSCVGSSFITAGPWFKHRKPAWSYPGNSSFSPWIDRRATLADQEKLAHMRKAFPTCF